MNGWRGTLRQFAVFCGVGGLNTIVSLALILWCVGPLNMDYRLANAVGYACGLALGFLMHRRITFGLKGGRAGREVFSFLAVFAFGYGLQFVLLCLLVGVFGMGKTWAQLPAWAIYVAASYAGNRYLTFRV